MLSSKQKSTQRGFTLIELLVIIAIIAVLAGMALVSLQTAQKGARDDKRRSDLRQLQVASQNFSNDNDNSAPVRTVEVIVTALTELHAGGYVSTFPAPPTSLDTYRYVSDADGVQYGFCTRLEKDPTKMINQTPTRVEVVDNGACIPEN